MRSEDLYKSLYLIANEYFNVTETDDEFRQKFFDNILFFQYEPWLPVLTELSKVMSKAMEEMETKITPKKSIAALRHIIEAVPEHRKNLRGIFKDADGMYCACDGYRLVRLKQDVSCLPHIENDMDTRRAMRNLGKDRIEMKLPTIAELKAHIKIHPGTKKEPAVPFFIDDCVPISAHYLLDMMAALPDCKAYLPSHITEPILFEAENGDGLICPVRAQGKKAEECVNRLNELRSKSA